MNIKTEKYDYGTMKAILYRKTPVIQPVIDEGNAGKNNPPFREAGP
jgi:hypothetical protein